MHVLVLAPSVRVCPGSRGVPTAGAPGTKTSTSTYTACVYWASSASLGKKRPPSSTRRDSSAPSGRSLGHTSRWASPTICPLPLTHSLRFSDPREARLSRGVGDGAYVVHHREPVVDLVLHRERPVRIFALLARRLRLALLDEGHLIGVPLLERSGELVVVLLLERELFLVVRPHRLFEASLVRGRDVAQHGDDLDERRALTEPSDALIAALHARDHGLSGLQISDLHLEFGHAATIARRADNHKGEAAQAPMSSRH